MFLDIKRHVAEREKKSLRDCSRNGPYYKDAPDDIVILQHV